MTDAEQKEKLNEARELFTKFERVMSSDTKSALQLLKQGIAILRELLMDDPDCQQARNILKTYHEMILQGSKELLYRQSPNDPGEFSIYLGFLRSFDGEVTEGYFDEAERTEHEKVSAILLSIVIENLRLSALSQWELDELTKELKKMESLPESLIKNLLEEI